MFWLHGASDSVPVGLRHGPHALSLKFKYDFMVCVIEEATSKHQQ